MCEVNLPLRFLHCHVSMLFLLLLFHGATAHHGPLEHARANSKSWADYITSCAGFSPRCSDWNLRSNLPDKGMCLCVDHGDSWPLSVSGPACMLVVVLSVTFRKASSARQVLRARLDKKRCSAFNVCFALSFHPFRHVSPGLDCGVQKNCLSPILISHEKKII